MKTILITGASSGIGAGLAKYYAQEGTELHLIARRANVLSGIAKECSEKGAKVTTHIIDVSDRSGMDLLIKSIDKLDLVIANAGISGGTGGISAEQSFEQDHQIFAINVGGVLNTIHPALPKMIDKKQGQIVIISSLASYLALPGAPAYTASKAAVRFYGEALAAKMQPYGVSVSVVCPGFVKSEMTDKNPFPMPFILSTDQAVYRIAQGISLRDRNISFPLIPTIATRLIQLLPSVIQNCIFMGLPEKKGLPKM